MLRLVRMYRSVSCLWTCCTSGPTTTSSSRCVISGITAARRSRPLAVRHKTVFVVKKYHRISYHTSLLYNREKKVLVALYMSLQTVFTLQRRTWDVRGRTRRGNCVFLMEGVMKNLKEDTFNNTIFRQCRSSRFKPVQLNLDLWPKPWMKLQNYFEALRCFLFYF